jgi:hypothetical protein
MLLKILNILISFLFVIENSNNFKDIINSDALKLEKHSLNQKIFNRVKD